MWRSQSAVHEGLQLFLNCRHQKDQENGLLCQEDTVRVNILVVDTLCGEIVLLDSGGGEGMWKRGLVGITNRGAAES